MPHDFLVRKEIEEVIQLATAICRRRDKLKGHRPPLANPKPCFYKLLCCFKYSWIPKPGERKLLFPASYIQLYKVNSLSYFKGFARIWDLSVTNYMCFFFRCTVLQTMLGGRKRVVKERRKSKEIWIKIKWIEQRKVQCMERGQTIELQDVRECEDKVYIMGGTWLMATHNLGIRYSL